MFVFEHLEHHHEYLNLSLSTKHTIINFGGQGNLALCVYSLLLITSVNNTITDDGLVHYQLFTLCGRNFMFYRDHITLSSKSTL